MVVRAMCRSYWPGLSVMIVTWPTKVGLSCLSRKIMALLVMLARPAQSLSHHHPTPFSVSVVEQNSVTVPPLVTPIGPVCGGYTKTPDVGTNNSQKGMSFTTICVEH